MVTAKMLSRPFTMQLPVELWKMIFEDLAISLQGLNNIRLTCRSLAALIVPEDFILILSRFKKDRDRFELFSRSLSLSRQARKLIWENLELEYILGAIKPLQRTDCDDSKLSLRCLPRNREFDYGDKEIGAARYTDNERKESITDVYDLEVLSFVLCHPECKVRSFNVNMGTGSLYQNHLTSIDIGLFSGVFEGYGYLSSRLRHARNLRNLKLRILPCDERDIAREMVNTAIYRVAFGYDYAISKMLSRGKLSTDHPPPKPTKPIDREVASLLSNSNRPNNIHLNKNKNIAVAIANLGRQNQHLTLDECNVTSASELSQLQSFTIQPRDVTGSARIAVPETKVLAYLKKEIRDLWIEKFHSKSRLYVYTE
ncbi:hypothetical protein RRF57_010845 [Xylaria bambusicola]|uniref:F-box domain-containing protein n=1 Tax=Xylaria bambusicola TaxID=326684 RepID=A0AAN7UX83_9PEZI